MNVHHVSVDRHTPSCPACSIRNKAFSLYCRGCFRPLLGRDMDDEPPAANERFVHLAGACEQVRGRLWTVKQFQEWLETFTAQQKEREDDIRTLEIPYGLEEDFADEQEVGWAGVQACNRGLAILRGYVWHDDHRLLEGLREFWHGVNMVKEAMQINRTNAGRQLWA